MSSTKTLMTVEEFARMRTADTEDYELVAGELVPLASGTPKRSIIRDKLGDLLRAYFGANKLGQAIAEMDCRTIHGSIRRPDLSVFLEAKSQQLDLDEYPIPFAPDIAIEILSPSESAIDLNRKINEYSSSGSREVWVIDYKNDELFIHGDEKSVRLIRGSDELSTPLLPGFAIRLSDLFK